MTTDLTATLASEPATRRHGWPLLVALHTALWGVVFAALILSGRPIVDFNLPIGSRSLTSLVGSLAVWLNAYWPFALIGLAFWTAIDGLVSLLLSRDPIGRGYRYWNIGQFVLAGGALLATVVGLFLILGSDGLKR